jgi:hypothetical protein
MHSNLRPATEFQNSNTAPVRKIKAIYVWNFATGPIFEKGCVLIFCGLHIRCTGIAGEETGRVNITCHTRKSFSMNRTTYPRDNRGDSVHFEFLDLEYDTRNPTNDVLTAISACRDDLRNIAATQTVTVRGP